MNQLYRALHIPPKRLLRKLSGEKEIYTIAVRPVPKAEGTDPLPALGGTPYTMLPARPGFWYADPLLYHRDGRRWLYAEAMDLATGLGRIEVCELHDDGAAGEWQVALQEDFHLSFPTVFDWNGETWMIPETGSDHSLRIYRCKNFPAEWELVQRFAVDAELCDTILVNRTPNELTLLCSETLPENQLWVRYRRCTLRRAEAPVDTVPGAQADAAPAPAGPFALLPDEAYPGQHQGGLWRLPAIFCPPRQQRGAPLRRHAPQRDHHRPAHRGHRRHPHLQPGREAGSHRRPLPDPPAQADAAGK